MVDNSTPQDSDDGLAHIETEDRDHVTMEVTVDVTDMDDDAVEVLTKLSSIYEDAFSEVVRKNRDYGFSFLKTGCKLAQTDATPFESAARTQAFGLLTRTGDKRERLLENVYGDGDAAVSDDADVTAMEAANYYVFLSFVLQYPELAGSFDGRGATPTHSHSSDS